MTTEETQFDGILMTIIQKQKGIQGFFGTIYSFLRRNTDFFSNEKQAQKVIVSECKKQFDIYAAEKKKKLEEQAKKQEREQARRQQQAEAAAAATAGASTSTTSAPKAPQTSTNTQKTEESQPTTSTLEVPAVSSKETESGETTSKPQEDKKEDNEKPPVGNGGRTQQYIWTQTLEELQLFVFLPKHITQKDLTVKIDNKKLYVCIQGETPLIDGEWPEKIHLQESDWTIQDTFVQDYTGQHIHFTIAKWKNNWHWWDSAIKGDAKINTQKIQPESSRLDQLDGETRSTVEKMMFDMRQQQMGLPSSDQLKKKEMLDGFMKAHPEMDFSKCQFN